MSDSSAKRQSLPRDAEGHMSPRAEQLSNPILQFNFRQEIEALRREPSFASSGRVAKQLAKHEKLRCTLIVIHAGAHIAEHVAQGEAAIHVLEGRIRMQLPGQVAVLDAGNLIVLGNNVKHDVTAEADSAFVATIAVSGGN
ncbi:MAG TPA: cupin domain-containing protein [Candidatus Acidoferrales bacterium]|nr:cupin domain-containing protein [Candidatus Acidoferrales bacterium]